MKKILASLMGRKTKDAAAPEGQTPQSLDPSTLLFSMPTISNDLAPVEPLQAPPQEADFVLHEDEWAQVEFFPGTKLADVQGMLVEYKAFEAEHRERHGWRNAYLRRIDRVPVLDGARALERLQRVLDATAGAAPILFSSGAGIGRVMDGFSLPLGGNVALYGYLAAEGIPVLAAALGENPDNGRLVDAFAKLHASDGLILVDWRQQLALTGLAQDGSLQAFRP
ncbi:hypothetical protein [Luteimonas aquatica]|uniref:hypothetical protein n=1 Tax=Luteimonas aquatica TaxID=450364 RepID=UPI001F55F456|nr:hypothetical protein [Luteimonas aquatica]